MPAKKNTKRSTSMKGNKNAVGNNGGVKTRYKKEYNEQARNYCLLGATDKQLGAFFDVDERTINRWKKDHTEFCQSIRAGKEIADMQVAESFFNNAKGFISFQKKAFKKKVWNEKAKRLIDEIEIVDEIVQHPPNTQAGIFWLKNRQPDKWKDKTEIAAVQEKPDLSKLSKEEKANLLKISRKLNG